MSQQGLIPSVYTPQLQVPTPALQVAQHTPLMGSSVRKCSEIKSSVIQPNDFKLPLVLGYMKHKFSLHVPTSWLAFPPIPPAGKMNYHASDFFFFK